MMLSRQRARPTLRRPTTRARLKRRGTGIVPPGAADACANRWWRDGAADHGGDHGPGAAEDRRRRWAEVVASCFFARSALQLRKVATPEPRIMSARPAAGCGIARFSTASR